MTKIIYEKNQNGYGGLVLTDEDITFDCIKNDYLSSSETVLPEISELEVMRHFKELSDKNFCVESGFYPLGSCTMKYNPKVNEMLSKLEGFVQVHPCQSDEDVQGSLELIYNLCKALKVITGMHSMTLQPAAGAHGELCGMMIVKKYFETIGENRTKVIVPDSAHGTNPASASMCGFNIIEVKSNEKGQVDIEEIKKLLTPDVAAIMMTNPNTLGIFEENILEISRLAHENGSLLYYDGANANAILGITNPSLMGFDIVHLNLHKTFSTPHGGGGPGACAVGVVEKLKDYLPIPVIEYAENKYFRNYNLKHSIGKMKSFYGNFGILIRAFSYILLMGNKLKNVSQDAVLNANYIKECLKKYYMLPYDLTCMHEFVLSGDWQKEKGVATIDIAKRLIDANYHPPTIYFPLIVHEALMIEPTESENKDRLDAFIDEMIKIADEVDKGLIDIHKLPQKAPVGRVDETHAARNPDLRYTK